MSTSGSDAADVPRPGRKIRQRRGRTTYEALVRAGFELLERSEFESISIAELAKAAGYSVGAFYARFDSKDQFLDALVAQHLESRNSTRARVLARARRETLIRDVIQELVSHYWKRRRFWRAVLLRGIRDNEHWIPLRDLGNQSANALLEKIAMFAGRELSDPEVTNVRFAFDVALGMINNSIVNRPGPSLPQGQPKFVENLVRTFRLVSDYDRLTGS